MNNGMITNQKRLHPEYLEIKLSLCTCKTMRDLHNSPLKRSTHQFKSTGMSRNSPLILIRNLSTKFHLPKIGMKVLQDIRILSSPLSREEISPQRTPSKTSYSLKFSSRRALFNRNQLPKQNNPQLTQVQLSSQESGSLRSRLSSRENSLKAPPITTKAALKITIINNWLASQMRLLILNRKKRISDYNFNNIRP